MIDVRRAEILRLYLRRDPWPKRRTEHIRHRRTGRATALAQHPNGSDCDGSQKKPSVSPDLAASTLPPLFSAGSTPYPSKRNCSRLPASFIVREVMEMVLHLAWLTLRLNTAIKLHFSFSGL